MTPNKTRDQDGRILLIARTPLERRRLCQVLEGRGFVVTAAASVGEAVDLLGSGRVRASLVVLDDTGLDARIELQNVAATSGLPSLLVLVGDGEDAPEKAVLTSQLRRPFDEDALIHAVKDALGKR